MGCVRQGKFEATKVLLLARLAEEERIGIPFMRTHFTHVEMRVVCTKRLFCSCHEHGLAWGLPTQTCRHMKTWELQNTAKVACQDCPQLLHDSASPGVHTCGRLERRFQRCIRVPPGTPVNSQHFSLPCVP